MALNYIWISFFLIGFIVALYKMVFLGQLDIFTNMMTALFDSAETGFKVSLGLTAMMALWLGIMKVGEQAGLIRAFTRFVKPLFKTLFKGVPDNHPAHGSIAMNFSANMLGLDNAATPLGLKAMDDLQSLNPKKDTATDAQIMFLVLNTVGLSIIPTSIIAIRQTMAVEQGLTNFNGADIFLPLLIITYVGVIIGMLIVGINQKINLFKLPVLIFILGFGAVIYGLWFWLSKFSPETMNQYIGAIGAVIIMLILIGFITAGLVKKINVYDNFVEGAKDGFNVAIKIIPYLIAMLAAISVLRSSGTLDFILEGIAAGVKALGLNTDFVPALPVALMKPLSGSGARGLLVDVLKEHGVNSFVGNIASILQGSTETTFYVLAVYFGSVNIKNTRNAMALGLLADALCIIVAILVGYAFFYH
ncbi:MAG TPA: nucleoside recognition domain-containing protein [Edaphocola sp.]|nr:nucleoside recognition domain-containing protein [Edaphocola sp.]